MGPSASNRQASGATSQPLMRLAGVCKTFERGGLFRKQTFCALRHIDLEVAAGETLAIVGISGSGKSTLAMCMAQLEKADSGEFWFKGKNLAELDPAELRSTRRRVQLIFQNAAASFNPRLKAVEIVGEPLDICRSGKRQERQECALECMGRAGLSLDLGGRSPLELSGGQRQRLSIARALTLSPELLIFDETFSGFDLVLEAQILELLEELKEVAGLTYVIISHDLSLVAGISDRVAVMRSGTVVEQGAASEVFSRPRHEHTQALLAASPRWDLERASGAEA